AKLRRQQFDPQQIGQRAGRLRAQQRQCPVEQRLGFLERKLELQRRRQAPLGQHYARREGLHDHHRRAAYSRRLGMKYTSAIAAAALLLSGAAAAQQTQSAQSSSSTPTTGDVSASTSGSGTSTPDSVEV